MKFFHLLREQDVSGVSGTGVVAIGVKFPSGKCVIEWLRPPSSLGVYQNIGEVSEVHGHEGATRIVMGLPTESTSAYKW